MRVIHPTLPPTQVATVPDRTFHKVLAPRGWIAAPDPADLPPLDDMTVAEVLDFVGDDPALAATVLAVETQGKARKGVIDPLTALTAAPGPDADADSTPTSSTDTTEES